MNLKSLSGEAAKFAGFTAALLVVYLLLRQLDLYQWTSPEAAGIAVLLQLIGDIYAVLLAFMIFVIWTQFTEVENCVTREAASLEELLRYTNFLTEDDRSSVRRAVTKYVHQILNAEWEELGQGREVRQADDAFNRLVAITVAASPRVADDHLLRENLLRIIRTVSQNRYDRIAKSLTRMPPTLSGLVKLIASVLLLLIVVYPFHSAALGAGCILVAALVLYSANFVMTDTDNPLKGVWNVTPEAFEELPH